MRDTGGGGSQYTSGGGTPSGGGGEEIQADSGGIISANPGLLREAAGRVDELGAHLDGPVRRQVLNFLHYSPLIDDTRTDQTWRAFAPGYGAMQNAVANNVAKVIASTLALGDGLRSSADVLAQPEERGVRVASNLTQQVGNPTTTTTAQSGEWGTRSATDSSTGDVGDSGWVTSDDGGNGDLSHGERSSRRPDGQPAGAPDGVGEGVEAGTSNTNTEVPSAPAASIDGDTP